PRDGLPRLILVDRERAKRGQPGVGLAHLTRDRAGRAALVRVRVARRGGAGLVRVASHRTGWDRVPVELGVLGRAGGSDRVLSGDDRFGSDAELCGFVETVELA